MAELTPRDEQMIATREANALKSGREANLISYAAALVRQIAESFNIETDMTLHLLGESFETHISRADLNEAAEVLDGCVAQAAGIERYSLETVESIRADGA
jgi:hypothetical protein